MGKNKVRESKWKLVRVTRKVGEKLAEGRNPVNFWYVGGGDTMRPSWQVIRLDGNRDRKEGTKPRQVTRWVQ